MRNKSSCITRCRTNRRFVRQRVIDQCFALMHHPLSDRSPVAFALAKQGHEIVDLYGYKCNCIGLTNRIQILSTFGTCKYKCVGLTNLLTNLRFVLVWPSLRFAKRFVRRFACLTNLRFVCRRRKALLALICIRFVRRFACLTNIRFVYQR